jgi:hypothetical protein
MRLTLDLTVAAWLETRNQTIAEIKSRKRRWTGGIALGHLGVHYATVSRRFKDIEKELERCSTANLDATR